MGKLYQLFYVNDAVWWSWKRTKSTGSRASIHSGHSERQDKKMPLWKKYARRASRLIRLFAAIDPKHPPRWFISLDFDRKVHREWSLEHCQNVFSKFKKYLAKTYPRCWFIYVWDYSPKAGFHVHLYGSFGKKKAWKKVRAKWLALTGSNNKRMTDKAEFGPKAFSYQVSPDKYADKLYLTEKLSGRALWGVIKKKNMPLSEVKTIEFDVDELYAFCVSAAHQTLQTKGPDASELNYLHEDSGCMYFAGAKLVKTALKYVRKVRRAAQ